MNHSAISMILKNKDNIMECVKSAVPIMTTIRSKKDGKVMEEMKRLLSVQMQDRHQHQVPLSLMLIQEKGVLSPVALISIPFPTPWLPHLAQSWLFSDLVFTGGGGI